MFWSNISAAWRLVLWMTAWQIKYNMPLIRSNKKKKIWACFVPMIIAFRQKWRQRSKQIGTFQVIWIQCWLLSSQIQKKTFNWLQILHTLNGFLGHFFPLFDLPLARGQNAWNSSVVWEFSLECTSCNDCTILFLILAVLFPSPLAASPFFFSLNLFYGEKILWSFLRRSLQTDWHTN